MGCSGNKETVAKVTTELELYALNHKAVMSHTSPASEPVKRLSDRINETMKTLPSESREHALLATASRKLNFYLLDLSFAENRYRRMYEMGVIWTRENQAEVDLKADQSRREIGEIAALLRK
jgi:hypothetical protein